MDGISDPHNVGSLIRTCQFLGVDGIAYPTRRSPDLSVNVSKASAGALEAYDSLYYVSNGCQFLNISKENGWLIIGAGRRPVSQVASVASQNVAVPDVVGMLQNKPTLLVLGNECKGLSSTILPFIDSFVFIPPKKRSEMSASIDLEDGEPIDSLNVGVAGGILINYLKQRQHANSHIYVH
jgi:tRNA G18 (ribose-2'-O)-methylase SpoU